MRPVVLALVVVMLAVAIAKGQVGSVSPGKLASVHAKFEAQCDRCHVAGGLSSKSCLVCHVRLAERLSKNVGFHATVTGKPCNECHKDHLGRGAALVPDPPATFDHRVAMFPLDGKHAQLPCARCHAARHWVEIPSTCARCHKDVAHRGQLGADCAKCHRAEGWKPPTRTAADHRVSLAGGHAKLTCVNCHRAGRHLVAEQACSHCHNQPHPGTTASCASCHPVTQWTQVVYTHRTSAARIEGKHQTLACLSCHPRFKFTPTPTSCAGCHDTQRPHRPLGACDKCHGAVAWSTDTFDHAAPEVGFAVDGAHTTLDCGACHTRPIKFGAPPRSCTGCHADVHGSQFASRACTTCHTTGAWRPSTIAATHHDGFGFALRDSHLRAPCAGCHGTGVFKGTATACATCHPDTRHRGRFGTRCESCHDATTWSHTTGFDHVTTGFRLERKHATVACAKCHGTTGMALVGRAAPTECSTCHATPHDRYFGARCATCHSTAGWRAVPPFDHDRTAFPLELRHRTLRCTACHHPNKRPPIQPLCRSCHGDPHRGSNSFECEDCHRPDRWRVIRFDHDQTAYPLTGRHRITACGKCHANPNWTGIRTDCVVCHAFVSPRDDTHLGTFECEDCHTTTSWRAIHR